MFSFKASHLKQEWVAQLDTLVNCSAERASRPEHSGEEIHFHITASHRHSQHSPSLPLTHTYVSTCDADIHITTTYLCTLVRAVCTYALLPSLATQWLGKLEAGYTMWCCATISPYCIIPAAIFLLQCFCELQSHKGYVLQKKQNIHKKDLSEIPNRGGGGGGVCVCARVRECVFPSRSPPNPHPFSLIPPPTHLLTHPFSLIPTQSQTPTHFFLNDWVSFTLMTAIFVPCVIVRVTDSCEHLLEASVARDLMH